jgi:hypothetical protein
MHTSSNIYAAGSALQVSSSSMLLFDTLFDQCVTSFDRADVLATFEFDAGLQHLNLMRYD